MCLDELRDILSEYPGDADVVVDRECNSKINGVEYDEDTNTVTIY